jgi:hypothetical protein
MSRPSFKRPLLLVALGFAAALGLVASNPSSERHRGAIGAAIAERRPLAGALGLGFLQSRFPAYHSFLIVSYTTLDGRLTSVGAAGQVWVNHGAFED